MSQNSFLIIFLLNIISFDISTAKLTKHPDLSVFIKKLHPSTFCDISTAAYLTKHPVLPVFTKILNPLTFWGKKCHCSREEKLTNMAPVKFERGHNYMVSATELGGGAYSTVVFFCLAGKSK
jgi:hypothetical protein